jgi:hypothetical protein
MMTENVSDWRLDDGDKCSYEHCKSFEHDKCVLCKIALEGKE